MDRVTLEVIGSALLTIAEEMGTALIKSAYSTNIKERQDCSTAIFDAHGEVIAQAEHIPMHLGSLLGVVREILARYPVEALAPGDVFIANDPYTGGGTHLPDINLVSPVFAGGALFGFVANIAHHADRSAEKIRTIWDEGLRITPIRLVEAGRMREDVMELLLANFALPARAPGRLPGADRRQPARRAAARRADRPPRRGHRAGGVRRSRWPMASARSAPRSPRCPTACTATPMRWTTTASRPSRFPSRSRSRSVAMRSRSTSRAAGRSARATSTWCTSRSSPRCTTRSRRRSIPAFPANSGFYRAITVTAPEGSIVNARPPAPVAWRTQTCQRIADVVLGALAEVVPERVPAAGNGANCAMVFSGTDPKTGKLYVYLETLAGGAGATAVGDGMDAVQVHVTNTSNLPVESLESEYPLLVVEYALVEGSGGSGRHRGGLGLRRTIEILGHEARFLGTTERARIAPWGLFGGGPGGRARLVLNPGGPGEQELPPKVWGYPLRPGDRVSIDTPGAGGYGPPP